MMLQEWRQKFFGQNLRNVTEFFLWNGRGS